MQENETIENNEGPIDNDKVERPEDVATKPGAGRPPRTRGRLRLRYQATALVLLVALGTTGFSAIYLGDDRNPVGTTASVDDQARIDAATRANRAERTVGPTPTASATATPPATASPATSAPAGTKGPGATKAPTKRRPAWVSPLPGASVTSCFGMRWGVLHAGIDLAEPENTPIHAAAAGTVVAAGWAYPGYGISVVIDHGNGYLTHYAHLNQTTVEVGQKIAAGTVVGHEGSTGDSTGPHLHFEVHQGSLWNQIDPAPFMRARGVDLGC